MIGPLLAQRGWAAVNEAVQGTGLVNGDRAGRVLDWLVSGGLLDHGRLPVVTAFAALGFGLAWLAWSADPDARALLIALGVCLLLAFGRTTFGSLVDLVPGSTDLFFRRFMMGVQLAALLLAGRGAAWLAAGGVRLLKARVPRWSAGPVRGWRCSSGRLSCWRPRGSSSAPMTAVTARPSRPSAGPTTPRGRSLIVSSPRSSATAAAGRTPGCRRTGARPSPSAPSPVFKYLDSRDVDEVGYTLRTASLMTGPENYFDDRDPSDYRLFGIRYLILPAGQRPPLRARLAMRSGPYRLWTIDGAGYVRAGQIAGEIPANRTNLGARSIPLLRSGLADDGAYLSVRYGSDHGGANVRLPSGAQPDPAGHGQRATRGPQPRRGHGRRLQMRRPGVAVLSASYDPGWTATVNGRRGRPGWSPPRSSPWNVPAGTDDIVFRFRGYRDYPELLALSGLTLAIIACVPLCVRRARRRR